MSVPEAMIRKRRVNAPAVTAPPPPALKLVPPIISKLDDAVAQPTLPAISVPAAPVRMAPPVEAPPPAIAAPAVRARYAGGEPDRLTKLRETEQYLQTAPLYDDANPDARRPSRGRAFLTTALKTLGEGMRQAQAAANAQGRPVQWSDVASGAAYALGAGAVGAVDTTVPLRMEREEQLADVRGQYGQEFERRGREAQLNEMEMKPALAAAKVEEARWVAEAEQVERQIDNLRDTWKHLPEYKRGDPRFEAIDAEAERLGVVLPDFAKDRPPRNPVLREVDGKPFQYDDETQTWVPAKGLPAEARIEVPGYGPMTPAAVYSADATREAGNVAAGTQYAVRATEVQNQNAQNAYRAQLAERDEALKAAQAFNALHGELDEATARYKVLEKVIAGAQPSTPQDKAALAKVQAEMGELAERIPALRAQTTEQLKSVEARYGRHLEYGSDERFRVNPAPPPPSVSAPPPPQMRQGPRAAPAPRRTGNDPLGLFR